MKNFINLTEERQEELNELMSSYNSLAKKINAFISFFDERDLSNDNVIKFIEAYEFAEKDNSDMVGNMFVNLLILRPDLQTEIYIALYDYLISDIRNNINKLLKILYPCIVSCKNIDLVCLYCSLLLKSSNYNLTMLKELINNYEVYK